MALVTLEWGHTVQEEPIPYYRDKSNRKNTPLATHKSILGGSHTYPEKYWKILLLLHVHKNTKRRIFDMYRQNNLTNTRDKLKWAKTYRYDTKNTVIVIIL